MQGKVETKSSNFLSFDSGWHLVAGSRRLVGVQFCQMLWGTYYPTLAEVFCQLGIWW